MLCFVYRTKRALLSISTGGFAVIALLSWQEITIYFIAFTSERDKIIILIKDITHKQKQSERVSRYIAAIR